MRKKCMYLALILLCCVLFGAYKLYIRYTQDTKPPVISFTEELPAVSASNSKEGLLQGVTAYDQKDGDVTDSLVVESIQLTDKDGSIKVTYAAFDKAGNVTKAVRQGKLTDYESPRFSLRQSLTFQLNSGFNIFYAVQAKDALDGDISNRLRITVLGENAISDIGTYTVELKVTNSLGETVQLNVPVEVYAPGTYEGTLKLTDYLIYLPKGVNLDTRSYLDTYTYGSTTLQLSEGIPEGYVLEVKSDVHSDVPGVYTVEYRLHRKMADGSQAYTGYAKMIVVVEG